MRIYLLGMMGSGKTFWGQRWAGHLHLGFVDLDTNIEAAYSTKISRIFDEKGELYFREIEKKELHKTALLTNHVISLGGGTPCFLDNMEWIKQHGTSIYLDTTIPVLQERLMMDKLNRPLLKNLHGEGLSALLENLLWEREPYYKNADYIFNEQECDEQSLDFIKQ